MNDTKIEPYSNQYYRRLSRLVNHYPCPHCGSPVTRGHVCSYCGTDPTNFISQEGVNKDGD